MAEKSSPCIHPSPVPHKLNPCVLRAHKGFDCTISVVYLITATADVSAATSCRVALFRAAPRQEDPGRV